MYWHVSEVIGRGWRVSNWTGSTNQPRNEVLSELLPELVLVQGAGCTGTSTRRELGCNAVLHFEGLRCNFWSYHLNPVYPHLLDTYPTFSLSSLSFLFIFFPPLSSKPNKGAVERLCGERSRVRILGCEDGPEQGGKTWWTFSLLLLLIFSSLYSL